MRPQLLYARFIVLMSVSHSLGEAPCTRHILGALCAAVSNGIPSSKCFATILSPWPFLYLSCSRKPMRCATWLTTPKPVTEPTNHATPRQMSAPVARLTKEHTLAFVYHLASAWRKRMGTRPSSTPMDVPTRPDSQAPCPHFCPDREFSYETLQYPSVQLTLLSRPGQLGRRTCSPNMEYPAVQSWSLLLPRV
jgi:hypothetical protein